jgi:hypothetical protein
MELERAIIDALAARPGGDVVIHRRRDDEILRSGRLATGIHDKRAVFRELAQAQGLDLSLRYRRYNQAFHSWERRFHRAWRQLIEHGVIASEYGGRSTRRYVRLTDKRFEPPPGPRTCYQCGAPMPGAYPSRKLCSDACRKAAKAKRNAATAVKRQERRRNRRDRYCDHCRKLFEPRRADQDYCSSTCKRAAYRARRVE